MKKLFLIVACLFSFSLAVPATAGNFSVPNYAASADVKTTAQTKGKDFTDLIAMVAAIICIMGIIWGGLMMGAGKAEDGKARVVWSIVGLVLVGCAYGLAVLAMK